MKKNPFVKQSGLKDCGVACLLMIIRYYHGNLSIEHLRELTKTSKSGTTAFHLTEAAKKLGMTSRGIHCDLSDLSSVVLPCIAHVTINSSYQHYVVIYKISKDEKEMWIADPASSLKKVKTEDFLETWNHVILTFFPTKKLPFRKMTSLTSFLGQVVYSYRHYFFKLFFLSVLMTILAIGLSFYFQTMIEGLTTTKDHLFFLFFLFLTGTLGKIGTDYMRNIVLVSLQQKLDFSFTCDLFSKIVSLPYSYYHTRTTGEMVSRISDLSLVRTVISKLFLTLFVDVPLTIGSFFFLALLNQSLFEISLFLFGGYLLLVLVFHPFLGKKIQVKKEEETNAMSYLVEQMQGYETIQSLGRQGVVTRKFQQLYDQALVSDLRLEKTFQLQYLGKELLQQLGFLGIIFCGCLLVMDGQLSIGGLFTFQALLSYFLGPIRNLVDLDLSLKEAKESLHRVIDLIEVKKKTGFVEQVKTGEIKFYHLRYSYDDYHDLLKDITFTIKKGEKVMIAGDSGSGKSTLFQLLMKYYDTYRTQIWIDDIDINDYQETALVRKIRYISQTEFLFTGSIKENVCGDEKKSSSFFLRIAELCRLPQIISENKLGYDLLLEENGANLSGGQRQQLVLARSLMIPFHVLIIDEAMSQMDIDLERQILKDLFATYEKETIIMISHRFDNLDLFSRLIEIKNGIVGKDVVYS